MTKMIDWGKSEYPVHTKPTPHIVLDALQVKPQINARWNTPEDNPPKACTCDMIHLAPYKNCTMGCQFCSLPRIRGYGILMHKYGVSVVFKNYDKYVDSLLERTDFAHTFDFGADADVFMDLNRRYHMTEKTMAVLNKWGVPFSVTTKGLLTEKAIEQVEKNKHNWVQYSIVTLDEERQRLITPSERAATAEQIKEQVQELMEKSIRVTARVQPYIPYFSEPLTELIEWVAAAGFNNVVFGLMRYPMSAGKRQMSIYTKETGRNFSKLYNNKTPGYFQVTDRLAAKIVRQARRLCDENDLKFGLCDMYTCSDGNYESLQQTYGSCSSCECVPAYGYKKVNGVFKRVKGCKGNCMLCETAACGHNQFIDGVRYNIQDYIKLGK